MVSLTRPPVTSLTTVLTRELPTSRNLATACLRLFKQPDPSFVLRLTSKSKSARACARLFYRARWDFENKPRRYLVRCFILELAVVSNDQILMFSSYATLFLLYGQGLTTFRATIEW